MEMYRFFTFTLLLCTSAHNYEYYSNWDGRRQDENTTTGDLDIDHSHFSRLKNYQVNAEFVSDNEIKWIAKVIHNREHLVPYICTAICIGEEIFITAGICVYRLKLNQTSIIYQDVRLPPKAFVLPTNETKQMFDDIGFIIIQNDAFYYDWVTVKLYNRPRTDDAFEWFKKIVFDEYEHKVIGYTSYKSDVIEITKKYHLTQLMVNVNINLCNQILVSHQYRNTFHVPCYHSCTLENFQNKMGLATSECSNYHGTEGGALINIKTMQLLGVATWGTYYHKYEMPVGFSIPNSAAFYEDFACAVVIRDDTNSSPAPGYYQNLCDKKTKTARILRDIYTNDIRENDYMPI